MQSEAYQDGLKSNSDYIQGIVSQMYDMKDKIKAINKEAYDYLIAGHEEYINRSKALNNWKNDNEIDAIKRWQSTIKDSYKQGLIDYQTYVNDMNSTIESLYDAMKAKQESYIKGVLAVIDKEKKAWQDTINNYEKEQNRFITMQILGVNWENDVLNQRTGNLLKFQSDYEGFCEQLDENVEGSVVNQINNLNDLSDKWNDSMGEITAETVVYQDVLSALSDFEKLNYSQRLTLLKGFVSDSKAELESLRKAQDNLNTTKTTTVKMSTITMSQDNYAGSPTSYTVETQIGKEKSFSEGGVIDYTGLAKVHGGIAPEMVVNNADVGKLYDYIHKSEDLAQNVKNASEKLDAISNDFVILKEGYPNIDKFKNFVEIFNKNPMTMTHIVENNFKNQFNADSLSNLNNLIHRNNTPINTINIGDIQLYGVNDVNSLSKTILNQFPNSMLQEMYKS